MNDLIDFLYEYILERRYNSIIIFINTVWGYGYKWGF